MKSYKTNTLEQSSGIEIPVTLQVESFGDVLEQAKSQLPGTTLFSSERGDLFMSGTERLDLYRAMRFIDTAVVSQVHDLQEQNPDDVFEPEASETGMPDTEGVRKVINRYPISRDRMVVVTIDFKPPQLGIENFRIPRVDKLVVTTEEISAVDASASNAA